MGCMAGRRRPLRETTACEMGDPDFADNDWETSQKCSVFRSTMDSYSYRLTHDLSLDSFQSEDIFSYEKSARSPTGSVFSNDSFTLYNTPRRIGSTSSSKDGSQTEKVREDMIELELSEGRRPYHPDDDPGDEAKKLLTILDDERKGRTNEKETGESRDREKGRGSPSKTKESSRRRRASSKENEHNSGQRSGERRRKSRRKGRKLPQMPTQVPANLQAELLAAEQRPLASPTDDSQSPTDNCQPQSSPSPVTSPDTPGKDDEQPCFQPVTLVIDGELKVQSHKALYRFFPRHDDEILLDKDDPVYVEVKGDDLWYEGINLRTGDEGCFPSRYVRDYTMEVDGQPGAPIKRVHISRFRLQFLGSVETPFHRGNEVLCRAMQKVVMARRMTPDLRPPTKCILEISDNGVRMIDQSKSPKPEEQKDSVRKKVEKFLSGKPKGHNYYFSLKNISYCGFHPQSSKYFGFITKHPNDRRFACHVFITENAQSGKPLAEAMGAAFKRFYAEFLDYTNPTEDIYLE
ncbi:C-Jun-amino-terminal kinase-interacting protein 1-like isoform X2 [Lytechinus pictus]|uniref:C-Jun-amino-terminal kinase-interacting protein 1-like isoform X2 n=1 Tax=Lytechinus pictus TaxID=7653 RepID=UPI0030BA09E6